jgi:bifunctional DNase/RNase
MTTVRIAHADPWPGRKPGGGMSISHVLVVLADDAGHRALPVRLPGRDGAFWRLLAGPEDRDEEEPEDLAEEMTGQLLHAAGIRVTAVTVTDLGPGVTAARIEFGTPGGTRQVTARLADGLALAVITGAPLAVDGPVMDRLAEPVTGADLLSPFRSRQQPAAGPRPHKRFGPRNLTFADGLHPWRLGGSFQREATGSHEQDYSCTTEDRRAILTAAVPEPAGFAFLAQTIFADDYRGSTLTFRGDLRTTDVADRAGLVLRVTSEGQLFPRRLPEPDPRHDPGNHFAPVTGSRDWTRHEVTAQIPPDAAIISFGAFLNGRGQIELRNAELERQPATSAASPRAG